MAMQFNGTLTKWNDDRGFGFIVPDQGQGEIFVHISAFSRNTGRPSLGERLSFEIEMGQDGKKRAIRVQRHIHQGATNRTRRTPSTRSSRKPLSSMLGLLAVVAAIVGYAAYSNLAPIYPATAISADYPTESIEPAAEDQSFRCDGRTHCSDMTSCAEAKYFLRHCPGTKMDGDGDGVPCEQQWCSSW
jgi:cold shock CspA family protein